MRSGTETEPITITGPADAVVRGGGEDHVIEVNHSYITFQGFTLDGLFGDPNFAAGYRDILLYAHGKGFQSGVTGMRVLNMTFRNSGGEAVRLRYFAQLNEVANSTFIDIGVDAFRFMGEERRGHPSGPRASSGTTARTRTTPTARTPTRSTATHSTRGATKPSMSRRAQCTTSSSSTRSPGKRTWSRGDRHPERFQHHPR
ncbi:MAG: hypothetical protein WKF75_02205 [Singulisphaera sp.]